MPLTQSQSQSLGAHFSVAGGLENALYEAKRLNCQVVQIFTKNGRTWKEPKLTRDRVATFKNARRKTGISQVFSHCTYLINIASHDSEKCGKSNNALEAEMIRSGRLGLDGVVLHPGAHLGQGIEKGLAMAIQSLNRVLAKDTGQFPRLLIETTAGSGSCLGSRFEEIGTIISNTKAGSHPIGVCLDTSHIFAAGYDIRTDPALENTLERFDSLIGLSRLSLIHMNDSKPDLGSRKDRHEHIGKGKIGHSGFKALMRHPALKAIPKIIETPKDLNGTLMDPVNLNCLTELLALSSHD